MKGYAQVSSVPQALNPRPELVRNTFNLNRKPVPGYSAFRRAEPSQTGQTGSTGKPANSSMQFQISSTPRTRKHSGNQGGQRPAAGFEVLGLSRAGGFRSIYLSVYLAICLSVCTCTHADILIFIYIYIHTYIRTRTRMLYIGMHTYLHIRMHSHTSSCISPILLSS